MKRRKSRARFFFLSLGCLHISEKNIENCNSVGAGAHKGGKVAIFWSNFDLNFTDNWRETKKGKLYTLTEVGLSTFKKIL